MKHLLGNITQTVTKSLKKLVTLNLLIAFVIGAGACDGQKTKSPPKEPLKIQLDVSGIDENKAFFVTPSGKANNDGSS